jgi:hypothetical protein
MLNSLDIGLTLLVRNCIQTEGKLASYLLALPNLIESAQCNKLNCHYHIHKTTALCKILGLLNEIHIITTYFPKIRFNVMFSLTPRFPTWFLPLQILGLKGFAQCFPFFHIYIYPFQLIILALIGVTIVHQVNITR